MFLYFLPGKTIGDVSIRTFRELGLATMFADLCTSPAVFDASIGKRGVQSGPNGGMGVIVAAIDRPAGAADQLGFYPNRQTWYPGPGGAYWIGHVLDVATTPQDLRRRQLVAGYDVHLGDADALGGDDVWHVATIRRGGRYPGLPRSLELDEHGELVQQVLPEYSAAWDASQQMFDHVFSVGSLPWETVFALCVDALAINYRVGAREVSILRLLTTQNYQEIYKAAIDWPKLVDLLSIPDETEQKKSAEPQTEPSTSPGPVAGFPRIFRPGATCSPGKTASGNRPPSPSSVSPSAEQSLQE